MIARLKNYRYLKKRWFDLVKEISELQEKRNTYEPITNGGVVGGIKGGMSSPTENKAIAKIYFYEQIDKLIAEKITEKEQAEKELTELDAFIESIPDVTIKDMADNKYRKGYGWQRVCEAAFYSPSSWNYVKGKVEGYILTLFHDSQY